MKGSKGQYEEKISRGSIARSAQCGGRRTEPGSRSAAEDSYASRQKTRGFHFFDAHCDTLTEFDAGMHTLYDAAAHFNVSKALAFGRYVQVADIWVDGAIHDVESRVNRYLEEFYSQLDILKKYGAQGTEEYPEGFGAVLIKSSEDLKKFYGAGRVCRGSAGGNGIIGGNGVGSGPRGANGVIDSGVNVVNCGSNGVIVAGTEERRPKAGFILGIEGGECIDCDAETFIDPDVENTRFARLKSLYRLGVRLITLTWNTPNAMSDTNRTANAPPGLTEFGRAALKEMNRLGIMADVSHISDAGFWDVVELSEKPVIASHSDSRTLCHHPRNLTDEMFTALARKGGVAGINFCTDFLGGSVDLAQIIRHIEHFASLGGIKNIGLGSDFDGIRTLPGGIDGVQSMYKIIDALLKMNYTEEQAEGIACGNFLRVFEAVLPPVEMLESTDTLPPEEA